MGHNFQWKIEARNTAAERPVITVRWKRPTEVGSAVWSIIFTPDVYIAAIRSVAAKFGLVT